MLLLWAFALLDPCSAAAAALQLQRLDMEARTSTSVASHGELQKVKEYKVDLAKLRADVKKAAASGGGAGASAEDRCAPFAWLTLGIWFGVDNHPTNTPRLKPQPRACPAALSWV
jgi:hypothetical protein